MSISDYSKIFVRYDLLTESPYYCIKRSVTENQTLQDVVECVVLGNLELIKEIVEKALERNKPIDVINCGLIEGMKIVSKLWDDGIYYLPQTLLASDTMLAGLDICERKLGYPSKKRGVAITHTAEGDIHDLGQKIVNALLRATGFEVIDLGKDVPVRKVVEAVRLYKPQLLCGTAHLTTTMGAFKSIATYLEEEGLIVPFVCGGGGGITQTFINSFNLGIYGKEAWLAPKIAEDACKGIDWRSLRTKYNNI